MPCARFQVRPAFAADGSRLAELRSVLWPDSSVAEHAAELEAILSGQFPRVMPMTVFVAEATAGGLCGFLEAGLRSSADGCDPTHPVGYVEGWFVAEALRGQG